MPVSPFEIFIPLISAEYPKEYAKLKFWHDTSIMIFPPGVRLLIQWRPPKGKIYIIFAITFGKPRDYATKEVVITDAFGFWHRHDPQMVWHWDPAVESIYLVETYPHYLEVERGTPIDLYFVNDTDMTIVWDFSIWIFECLEADLPLIRQYFRGILNTCLLLGKIKPEEIVEFVKKVLKKPIEVRK